MILKQHVLDTAGGSIQRFVASVWLQVKDFRAVAKFTHAHRPKDVIEQWEKVENAQDNPFISPVFWSHFPTSMKGWFEGVFSYGGADTQTPVGRRGEIKGRVPLLQHK
jgi:putative NADPH-quinone reductase